jgi:phenylacetate-CoA ligase
MERDALAAHQLHSLRRLLADVSAGNSFYQPLLRQAGLIAELSDFDTFFRNMPFTQKADLIADQLAHPPYGTNLTYPLASYCRMSQTSGSSGAPLRWLDTHESWQWMLDNWKQIYAAAGITSADCVYFAFSFGPFLGFWTAYEAACRMGCRSLPGGGLSSLARLQAMLDNQATALLCTPTYALRLAEVAEQEKFDCGRLSLRTIIVAGEPGGSVPAVRQRIEQAWPQAVLCDHHGMTEVGPVTYQRRNSPGLLTVIETSYIAEIIEPSTGQQVLLGEVGELVLTTLGRIGSPLIRYRTGDLVRQSVEASATAGQLTLQGGILGRIDDMLVVRGVNIFPSAVEDLMQGMADVGHYQIEIDSRGPMVELRLLVEPLSDDCAGLGTNVESRVRAAFNLRIAAIVVAPGSLPRGEMKTRRWVHKK